MNIEDKARARPVNIEDKARARAVNIEDEARARPALAKRLDQLLSELLSTERGDSTITGLTVRGLTEDSRQVQPGHLFFAIEGLTVDGHAYAPQAVENGAVAVVGSRETLDISVPYLRCDDPARMLGIAASRFYDEPAKKLETVGMTGTNGKTTTTTLLEGLLRAAGHRPGLVGTVAYRFGDTEIPAPFTTPTAVQLQSLLAQMVDAGCDMMAMEVSSHGLSLGRVSGMQFDVAAFSHLTQDHLDLHGSMEAYLEAKLRLFREYLVAGGTAVVNVDGQKSEAVLDAVAARGDVTLLRCSTQREDVELYLKNVRCDIAGLTATLVTKGQSHDIRSPLLGAYNADNLLLAIGCALAIGVTPETACEVAGRLVGVPGRLERVDQSRELAVLVDYAHTPDALSRALTVLAPLVQNRLICVFGCGGDRDRKKRPLMGRAVAELADVAIVTSDNPRSEDPQAIIDEILPGIEKTARLSRSEQLAVGDTRCYAVIKDRAQAIARSVELLQAGDILLIAGKGHEDYQILGKRRIHFDDREHAKAALSSRGL